MASKYNMTIEEFNNFSSVAHEALSEPKPQWTFSVAIDFVFQVVTTIGKVKYKIIEICAGLKIGTFHTNSVMTRQLSTQSLQTL